MAPTPEGSAGSCGAGPGLSLFDPEAPAPPGLIPLPVGMELGFASPGMPYGQPPRGGGEADLQKGRLRSPTPGLWSCPHIHCPAPTVPTPTVTPPTVSTPTASAPSGLTASTLGEGDVEARALQLRSTEVCSASLPVEKEGGRPSRRAALLSKSQSPAGVQVGETRTRMPGAKTQT